MGALTVKNMPIMHTGSLNVMALALDWYIYRLLEGQGGNSSCVQVSSNGACTRRACQGRGRRG